MTPTQEAAMRQALEALVDAQQHSYALIHRDADELIAALKAALAEPVQEAVIGPCEHALIEVLAERDGAEEYIDAILDEVLGPDRAEWSSAYGRADALEEVRERIAQMLKPSIDKAWNRFEVAPPQKAEPVSVADLQAALVETDLIDPDALFDPDGYDAGSTVAQIDELHRLLFQRPAEPVQNHFPDVTKMAQEPVDLPPLPADVLSIHGPIWSRILDWNDASIGEEAVRAADEITRVVQEQMQAYARAAVAAQSRPAEPREPTGCAHCTHPLYAGVKCGSCGRVRA